MMRAVKQTNNNKKVKMKAQMFNKKKKEFLQPKRKNNLSKCCKIKASLLWIWNHLCLLTLLEIQRRRMDAKLRMSCMKNKIEQWILMVKTIQELRIQILIELKSNNIFCKMTLENNYHLDLINLDQLISGLLSEMVVVLPYQTGRTLTTF